MFSVGNSVRLTKQFDHYEIDPSSSTSCTDYMNSSKEVVDDKNNVFRKLFKFYKKREGNVDISNVMKLRASNIANGIKCLPIELQKIQRFKYAVKKVGGLRDIDQWTVSTISHRPGLYVLNNIFLPEEQFLWIKRCLLEYPEAPNITNVSANGEYTQVFKNVGEKLRWTTLGNDYDWNSKEYAKIPSKKLPREIAEVSSLVVQILGLRELCPDAAIINYYPAKATLSPHVDKSERDLSRPLVSLSFGQSAIYMTGGRDLEDPSVDALLLNSGDVLVMDGDQRLVYHAVPRILKTTNFELAPFEDNKDVLNYANKNRVNITVRQVE